MKIAAMVGAPDLKQPTLAIYRGDLDLAFQKLARLGYDGVEIMTRNPQALDGKYILAVLDANGLELAGLCTGHVYGEDGLGLVSPDPENCRLAFSRMRCFIDFAAQHFAPGALVNIGRVRGQGFPDDPGGTLERMEEVFHGLAEYAATGGVRLVLEPINVHQANHLHTTQDGIAMVKRVNHPHFGLMLDVYHMNIEDVSIEASFLEAKEFCWFVHFADNNRKWPGSAHLNFENIVQTLRKIQFDGFISLEILPWPDPDTAARASIASLRHYIPKSGSIQQVRFPQED